MGKSLTFDNQFLKLTFQAKPIANIADNAASAPLTVLWMSLHTADPTSSGNQNSSQATYGAYARVSVARTSVGWVATSNSISPGANITFPACTSGSNTITYAAVGTASSGTGEILYSGTVTPSISVTAGVTPRLTTASTITES